MRTRATFTFVVTLFLIVNTPANGAKIQWSKQISTDAGFVATTHDLFLTTTGGKNWEDITPPQIADGRVISAVFFRDVSLGWAVLARQEDDDQSVPVRFWLASTRNSGASWSLQPIVPPNWLNLPEGVNLDISLEDVSIYFWDDLRGIVAVGSDFLLTADGGKTWHQTSSPGFGSIVFTTRNDGWVRGESAKFDYQGQLFVTHDGSKSWRPVVLPGPKKEDANSTYGVPFFTDERHGFVSIEYSGPKTASQAFFSTADGGATWKQDGAVPLVAGRSNVFTVLGLEWKAVALKNHVVTIARPAPTSAATTARVDENLEYLYTVTFIDRSRGWALMGVNGDGADQVLSTTDAGASWNIITPTAIKGNLVGVRARAKGHSQFGKDHRTDQDLLRVQPTLVCTWVLTSVL